MTEPSTDSILAALKLSGIVARGAYDPTEVHVPVEAGALLLTRHFNREDGGWEAVAEVNDDQHGLADGPAADARPQQVVDWVRDELLPEYARLFHTV